MRKKINLKSYRRNIKAACDAMENRIPQGYTTDFAPNGDFIVRSMGRIIGRLKPDEIEPFCV